MWIARTTRTTCSGPSGATGERGPAGSRGRFLKHGWIIAFHRIVWDVITYPCLGDLLLIPKSSYTAYRWNMILKISKKSLFFAISRLCQTNWWSLLSLGPQCPQGTQGAPGEQGPSGQPGPAGPSGPSRSPGERRPAGNWKRKNDVISVLLTPLLGESTAHQWFPLPTWAAWTCRTFR